MSIQKVEATSVASWLPPGGSIGTWIVSALLLAGTFTLGALVPSVTYARTTQEVSFLPPHYVDALTVDGQGMRLKSETENNEIKRAVFTGAKEGIQLAVEQRGCDSPRCEALYEQILREQNTKLTQSAGQFRSLTPVEFTCEWKSGSKSYLQYVARTPKTITIWTWTTKKTQPVKAEKYLEGVRSALDRQRFIEATQMDNVEIGRWAQEIHRHSRDMLTHGQIEEALLVLQQVITWSASSYEAQLDFAENTQDAAAARMSALAVWENAESPTLTARAARLLGLTEIDGASLPVLEQGLRGLQVVVVPLPPCDLRVVEEAGRLYSEYLQVPVRLARLPKGWQWGRPDRVFRQRDIQVFIQQRTSKPVDFTGWGRDTYADRLMATTAKEDALTRYQIRTLVDELKTKPGQYKAELYVDQLIDMIAPLRSEDKRTMIVGVTEADIYGGESNFLFSGTASKNGNWAGILSYARMQATTLNESYQSRKRLTERLAKEMVPASLKQLGIPRPTDPTDPYSYSSGVDRLNQKSLTLSQPTREALDKLRTH